MTENLDKILHDCIMQNQSQLNVLKGELPQHSAC